MIDFDVMRERLEILVGYRLREKSRGLKKGKTSVELLRAWRDGR